MADNIKRNIEDEKEFLRLQEQIRDAQKEAGKNLQNAGQYTNIGARIGYRHAFMKADGKNEKFAMKLSLVGKNLLNQEYTVRPALVGAPLNVTVRLDVEF